MSDDVVEAPRLGSFDYVTLALYFTSLFGVAMYCSWKANRKKEQNTEGYFLAERSVKWWAVGASLFASNIGSEHFIGLAGSAARDGFAVGWYEVGAIPLLILLALFFLPVYLNSAISTTPDYMERRYGTFCKNVMVVATLFLYVFTKVSATLYAGEIILVELTHMNKWFAVILLISITALYTVLGGLEAVIYTEFLQTAVLLLGGFMVLILTMSTTGGLAGLHENLPDTMFHFVQPASDPQYPWTGFLFGYYVVSPWYWGIDQVMVQRPMAAKNIVHGQYGCLCASVLKFLPFFIMVLPGVGARYLIEKSLDFNATAIEAFDFDRSYPWLVLNVVPVNARGFILASMLASLMSALASVFNSSATLFTLNVWKSWHPESSERQLVVIGRLTVVCLAIVALLWLPVIPLLGNELFLVIQRPAAYVAPPILCLFVWGMLSTFPHPLAGKWALTFGVGFGGLRFLFEVIEAIAGKSIFGGFTGFHFLNFAAIMFWVCTLILMAGSFAIRHRMRRGVMDVAVNDALEYEHESLYFNKTLFESLYTTSIIQMKSNPEAAGQWRLYDWIKMRFRAITGKKNPETQLDSESNAIELRSFSINREELALETEDNARPPRTEEEDFDDQADYVISNTEEPHTAYFAQARELKQKISRICIAILLSWSLILLAFS